MHVGRAATFIYTDDDPADTHRPQRTWTERVDPSLPDFGEDRPEGAGTVTTSPYA
jgi:hypothetical protein